VCGSWNGIATTGNVRRIGQRWTVESWLQHWLENIARPSIRDSSFNAYRIAVNKHLIPGLGEHRLERLESEHLEVDEVQRILEAAMQRPNGARWAIALALELR
jgi:Phage integrase, N-terminal SAM-like domain